MHAIQYVPLILAGIVLLLFGGDFLVRGGAALARLWRLPNLLVGLTIVAFGTSAPELVVSVQSALTGAPGLAVGNIVGSNIANFLLVLGLPALFGTIYTTTPGLRRNAIFALGAAIVLIVFGWDREISLQESGILLAAIVGYVALLGIQARKNSDDPTLAELTDIEHMDGLPKTLPSILLALAGGLIALPLGAQMIVTGGIAAARDLHVEPALIGLTAVALGTSLPELATVVMASVRRQADLAIGNVLGSNIFNVFAVGGATGLAASLSGHTLPIAENFFLLDFWVMLGASVVIAGLVLLQRPITRVIGALLCVGYFGYIAVLARSAMA
ncbi:calcium/sodium antiporter [Maricaulis sp.]|uniref:calcium/sodium antiporter n=1 Tax=Maricaulis sp. TaxID=1486257 RepID=UPI003A92B61C